MMLRRVVVLVAVLAAVACASSDGRTKAKTAADRMAKLGENLTNLDYLIESTVTSLNALSGNPEGDINAMFDTYLNELSKLETAAERTRKRAGAVWDQKDEFLKEWERSLTTIKNEEFRKLSQSRKAEVEEGFVRVKETLDKTKASFDPLLANLQDIRTMLTTDLNANGVKAIAPIVKDVNEDAAKSRASLVEVKAEFDKLAMVITPPQQPAEQPTEKTDEQPKP